MENPKLEVRRMGRTGNASERASPRRGMAVAKTGR